jgi:PIN domain nuclease of toxin-antitoxin system
MILLDTNALLFYLFKADQLSDAAMNTITYSDEAWVSIASFWEIAIKNSIGKLELKCSVSEMAEMCVSENIEILAIRPRHLDIIKSLPDIHKDPFDRLIVAQAISEKMSIVTRDTIIPKYPVNVIW